jgi:hypothetical protein
VFWRQTQRVIGSADTGISNQDVDWTKLAAHAIGSFTHGFGVAHVSRNRDRLNTLRARFVDDLIEQLFTTREQAKVRAARSNL